MPSDKAVLRPSELYKGRDGVLAKPYHLLVMEGSVIQKHHDKATINKEASV